MKMKAVLDWLVTKLVKFIQKFLGLANYYQRFIEEFAKMVKPLHKLMRKEQKWNQEIRQEKSFETLKKQFTTEPILLAPDLDKKIRMKVDASDYATGGILFMECEVGNGDWWYIYQSC